MKTSSLVLSALGMVACVPHPVQPVTTETMAESIPALPATVQITNVGTWWGHCYIAAAYQKPDDEWDRYSGAVGMTRLPPTETIKIAMPEDWPLYTTNTTNVPVCFVVACEEAMATGEFIHSPCYSGISSGGTVQCDYDGYNVACHSGFNHRQY